MPAHFWWDAVGPLAVLCVFRRCFLRLGRSSVGEHDPLLRGLRPMPPSIPHRCSDRAFDAGLHCEGDDVGFHRVSTASASEG